MIRKKNTTSPPAPAPQAGDAYLDDEQFKAFATKLRTILASDIDADAAAKRARTTAAEAKDMAIKKFVEEVTGLNAQLRPNQEEALAKECSLDYAESSQSARKSEYLTLIKQRQNLAALYDGVKEIRDEIKAKDEKASVNVRQRLIKACRLANDDPGKNVKGVLADLRALMIPAPKTDEDKGSALIDRVADLESLHEKVGDERVIKAKAEKALQDLRDMIHGREPANTEVVDSPEYKALQRRYDALKTKVARARLKGTDVDLVPEEVVEPFAGVDPSLAEALGATLEAAGEEEPLDTGEEPEAAPEPADELGEALWGDPADVEAEVEAETEASKPKQGSMEASVSTSLTGFSVQDLLDMQTGKK